MANFAAKKDSMSALISQTGSPPAAAKAETQMKHFEGAESGVAMESLIEQTGGPDAAVGSKKQFAPPGPTAGGPPEEDAGHDRG